VLAEGVDQAVEHLNRDVPREQRRLKRRAVMPRPRHEDVLLDGCCQVIGECVLERQIPAGVTFPGGLAQRTVAAGQVAQEVALLDRQRPAVLRGRRPELNVRVGEHAGCLRHAAERIGQHAEHLFDFRRTDVSLFAEDVVEVMRVGGQARLGLDPSGERLLADGEDLRLGEGGGGQDPAVGAHRLPGHRGGPLIGRVDRAQHAGVDDNLARAPVQGFVGGQIIGERAGAVRQFAVECGAEIRQIGHEGLVFGVPVGDCGEDAGRVPGVLGRDRAARRQGRFRHDHLLSCVPGPSGAGGLTRPVYPTRAATTRPRCAGR